MVTRLYPPATTSTTTKQRTTSRSSLLDTSVIPEVGTIYQNFMDPPLPLFCHPSCRHASAWVAAWVIPSFTPSAALSTRSCKVFFVDMYLSFGISCLSCFSFLRLKTLLFELYIFDVLQYTVY